MGRPRMLLTIGDIVTIALRLYLQRLRQYWIHSLVAHLWLLVPLYGWFKFAALSGHIAQRFWYQLSEREAPEAAGDRVIASNFIRFWLIHLLIYLVFIASTVVIYIALVIALILFAGLIWLATRVNILDNGTLDSGSIITLGLGFLFIGIFAIGNTLAYSRLFLSELPLAISPQTKLGQAIGQSWRLSSKYTLKTASTLMTAWLMTVPLALVLGALNTLIFRLGTSLVDDQAIADVAIALLFIALTTMAHSLMTLPFWQAVKVVTYQDLQNRQSGTDLKLRPN